MVATILDFNFLVATSDYTLQFANLMVSYVAKWGVILWMIARRFEILCLVMIINLMDDLLNPLRNSKFYDKHLLLTGRKECKQALYL